MVPAKYMLYAVIGVTVLIAAIFLVGLFINRTRTTTGDSALYELLLAEKDRNMRLKDSIIAIYEADNSRLDTEIATLRRADSLSRANFYKQQVVNNKRFHDELSKIPDNITSISGNDDSIRAAFAR
jgi:hypothetical protein